MGILLEADYKGVLTGKESPYSGLKRAFSRRKGGSVGNPLEKGVGEELKSEESDGQLTYELMNRDSGTYDPSILISILYTIHPETPSPSPKTLTNFRFNFTAITLARQTSTSSVPAFVFLSAAAGAPMLPQRYITTKRDAESTIASSFPKMRNIFIRPGFLYDNSRTFTLPIAAAGTIGNIVNGMVGGRLSWLAGAAVEKPLKADLVAEAVVEAVEDESVKGMVLTERIEELAQRAWRRDML